MHSSGQQNVVFGHLQHPTLTVSPEASPTFNPGHGNLLGSKRRRNTSIIQIICGFIQIPLGIVVICLPVGAGWDVIDYVGWAIWNGLFVILTGVIGVNTKRKRSMVITYMVNSIISAVVGAGLLLYAFYGTIFVFFAPLSYEYRTYPYHEYSMANLTIYVILGFLFVIQSVISIIGASFTCCDVQKINSHQQQFVYYNGCETPNTVSVQLPPNSNISNAPPPYSPFPDNSFIMYPSHDVTGGNASSNNADINASSLPHETVKITNTTY